MRQLYSVRNDRLGIDVQAGEEGQPLIEHGAHDVTVACVAEELQVPAATARRTRPGPSSIRGSRRVRGACPARPRSAMAGTGTGRRTWCGNARGVRSSWRTSATSATTGRGWSGRSSSNASWQLGEALLLQDRGDRRRAERLAFAGEGAADVVDGEILLPQRDDLFPQPFLLAAAVWPWRAVGTKKSRFGLIAELMDEDAKTPGVYPNRAAASAEGTPSTKKARRASYCRWVELEGSRNRRASVRRSLELSSMLPRCHPDWCASC